MSTRLAPLTPTTQTTRGNVSRSTAQHPPPFQISFLRSVRRADLYMPEALGWDCYEGERVDLIDHKACQALLNLTLTLT